MLPSFASPWFLIGILTVAAPFLMLLTRASTHRTTPFSSLVFLRAVTEKASRIIEWKRLILLFFRVAILGLLALAFAIPYFRKGGVADGMSSGEHVLIVIDNSYSMGYAEKGKTFFEEAVKSAENLIKESKSKKPLYSLYSFASGWKPIIERQSKADKVLSEIKKLPLLDERSDFSVIKHPIEEIAKKERNRLTRVFIFSDFSIQDQGIQDDWLGIYLPQGSNIRVKNIPFQPVTPYHNLAVEKLILPSRPLLPKTPEQISVAYKSFGMADKNAIRLKMNGEVIETVPVDLKQNPQGVVHFKVVFPYPERFLLEAESAPDFLMTDNKTFSVAEVHEPIRILLIEDRTYAYPFENPYFYLTQVLESAASPEEDISWIKISRHPVERLSGAELRNVDLVFLSDLQRIPNQPLLQLRKWVREGGNVIVSLGGKSDFQFYGKDQYLKIFLGGNFQEPVEGGKNNPVRKFGPIRYDYSLFKIFDYGRQGDLAKNGVKKFAPFSPSQDESTYEVLMWIENQWPALIERKLGRGRLFIWTTSLNDDWTDFPKNPLYVPMMYEWIKYSALKNFQLSNQIKVGDYVPFDIDSQKKSGGSITLRNPKGERTVIFIKDPKDLPRFSADQKGFYEWLVPDSSPGRFMVAVNLDTEESTPNYLSLQAMSAEAGQEEPQNAPQAAFAAKRQTFYTYLFIALLAFLLLESLFANRIFSPRWG